MFSVAIMYFQLVLLFFQEYHKLFCSVVIFFFIFIIDKLLTQLEDTQIEYHINGLFPGTIA